MTVETKSDLKTVAGILGATAVALIVGVNFTPNLAPVRTKTIRWTETEDSIPGDVIEIWSSTNLVNYTLKTNVPALVKMQRVTNSATFPELSREFFINRVRRQIGSNVIYSPWNIKTTL